MCSLGLSCLKYFSFSSKSVCIKISVYNLDISRVDVGISMQLNNLYICTRAH